ncbi:hypothetical protein JTB14_021403 [Gonioctena quinquepunctata]|nr:hypothetical protein JTB14_021403 [Gonioctena quinquepunctata]
MGDVTVQQPTFEVSSITTTVMMATKENHCYKDQYTAFLWNMARFYASGPTPEELVTCLYGMFMNLLPKHGFLDYYGNEVYKTQMDKIFSNVNIKMLHNYIKTSGVDNGLEATKLLNDTYIKAVKHAFGQENFHVLFTKPEFAYIMGSIILLLSIGGTVTQKDFSKWFASKVKEFSECSVYTEIFILRAPNWLNINTCNLYLKFHPTVRAEFVRIILAALPHIQTKFQYTLRRVVQCCEYQDMEHVLLIDTYLGKYEMKFTGWPGLELELALYKKAKTYLNSLPSNERLLCKLTGSDTSLLDIKHFPLLVAVAERCVKQEEEYISEIKKGDSFMKPCN